MTMCRMGGFSLRNPDRGEAVRYVFEQVQRMAKDGEGAPHPDGWGYRVYTLDRETDSWVVCEGHFADPIYEDSLELTTDGEGFVAGVVHARHASEGMPVDAAFTHPLSCCELERALAHNGTIYDVDLRRFPTDTLYLCNYLCTNFPRGGSATELAELVTTLASEHKFSGLNFILLDGWDRSMFVCCLFSPEYRSPTYFVLHYKVGSTGFFVFSEPPDGSFHPMGNGQILKVKEGRIVEMGWVGKWRT